MVLSKIRSFSPVTLPGSVSEAADVEQSKNATAKSLNEDEKQKVRKSSRSSISGKFNMGNSSRAPDYISANSDSSTEESAEDEEVTSFTIKDRLVKMEAVGDDDDGNKPSALDLLYYAKTGKMRPRGSPELTVPTPTHTTFPSVAANNYYSGLSGVLTSRDGKPPTQSTKKGPASLKQLVAEALTVSKSPSVDANYLALEKTSNMATKEGGRETRSFSSAPMQFDMKKENVSNMKTEAAAPSNHEAIPPITSFEHDNSNEDDGVSITSSVTTPEELVGKPKTRASVMRAYNTPGNTSTLTDSVLKEIAEAIESVSGSNTSIKTESKKEADIKKDDIASSEQSPISAEKEDPPKEAVSILSNSAKEVIDTVPPKKITKKSSHDDASTAASTRSGSKESSQNDPAEKNADPAKDDNDEGKKEETSIPIQKKNSFSNSVSSMKDKMRGLTQSRSMSPSLVNNPPFEGNNADSLQKCSSFSNVGTCQNSRAVAKRGSNMEKPPLPTPNSGKKKTSSGKLSRSNSISSSNSKSGTKAETLDCIEKVGKQSEESIPAVKRTSSLRSKADSIKLSRSSSNSSRSKQSQSKEISTTENIQGESQPTDNSTPVVRTSSIKSTSDSPKKSTRYLNPFSKSGSNKTKSEQGPIKGSSSFAHPAPTNTYEKIMLSRSMSPSLANDNLSKNYESGDEEEESESPFAAFRYILKSSNASNEKAAAENDTRECIRSGTDKEVKDKSHSSVNENNSLPPRVPSPALRIPLPQSMDERSLFDVASTADTLKQGNNSSPKVESSGSVSQVLPAQSKDGNDVDSTTSSKRRKSKLSILKGKVEKNAMAAKKFGLESSTADQDTSNDPNDATNSDSELVDKTAGESEENDTSQVISGEGVKIHNDVQVTTPSVTEGASGFEFSESDSQSQFVALKHVVTVPFTATKTDNSRLPSLAEEPHISATSLKAGVEEQSRKPNATKEGQHLEKKDVDNEEAIEVEHKEAPIKQIKFDPNCDVDVDGISLPTELPDKSEPTKIWHETVDDERRYFGRANPFKCGVNADDNTLGESIITGDDDLSFKREKQSRMTCGIDPEEFRQDMKAEFMDTIEDWKQSFRNMMGVFDITSNGGVDVLAENMTTATKQLSSPDRFKNNRKDDDRPLYAKQEMPQKKSNSAQHQQRTSATKTSQRSSLRQADTSTEPKKRVSIVEQQHRQKKKEQDRSVEKKKKYLQKLRTISMKHL